MQLLSASINNDWPHLPSIPFDRVSNRRYIDILIGIDHPVFHKMSREVTGRNPKEPVARQTPLGWVCFGPTNKNHSHRTTHAHMTRQNQPDQHGSDKLSSKKVMGTGSQWNQ
jgi:hypothetical protein